MKSSDSLGSQSTYQLLFDEPASADAFGPHDDIAAELAQLILAEDRGVAISLKGSFGSGKSTIIKLLRNHLSDKARIFVFDAWAHAGDSLRRTFLEKLIFDLVKEPEWVDKKKWTELSNELSGYRKREETKSTPFLTPAGFWVAMMLACVPVGSALKSSLDGWYSAFAYLLIALPILVGAGFFGLNYFTGPQKDEGGRPLSRKERWCKAASIAVGLLTSKSTTVVTTETLATPEPTSVEFESTYCKLISDALGNHDTRRLVVVIDNLDRLDSSDTKLIWSTLSTFTGTRADADTAFKRVWLIVPIDPVKHRDGNTDGDRMELLSKTFQVSITIPQPLLTKWKNFFDSQLHMAISGLTKQQMHRVYRIYAVMRVSDIPPTPRDITVFLNKLGLIHSLRHEEIRLEMSAFSVMLEHSRSAEGQDLMNIMSQVPPGLRDIIAVGDVLELAALHYGVPLSDAPAVLYGSKIEAFIEGSSDDLDDLVNQPGFWLELEKSVDKNLAGEDNQSALLRAVLLVSKSGALEREEPVQRTLVRILKEVCEKERWIRISEESAQALLFAVSRTSESVSKKRIVRSVLASYPQPNDPGIKESIQQYACALSVFIHACSKDAELLEAFDSERLQADAGLFVALVRAFISLELSEDQVSILQISTSTEQLTAALEREFVADPSPVDILEVTAFLERLGVDANWLSLAGVAASNVKDPPYPVDRTSVYWKILNIIEQRIRDDVAVIISTAVSEGFALRTYLDAHNAGDYDTAGLLLFNILWHDPETTTYPSLAERPSETTDIYSPLVTCEEPSLKILQSVLTYASNMECVDELVRKVNASISAKVLIPGMMRALSQDRDQILALSRKLFVECNGFALILDKDTLNSLISTMLTADLAQTITGADFDESSWHLYASIVSLPDAELTPDAIRDRSSVLGFVENHLRELPSDRWEKELLQGGAAFTFLEALGDLSTHLNLEGHLVVGMSNFDAVNGHACLDEAQANRIHLAVRNLTESAKDTVGRNVLSAILNKQLVGLPIIKVYESVLSGPIILEKADDVVRQLITPAVSAQSNEDLDLSLWLLERADQLVNKSLEASIEVLRGLLEQDFIATPEPTLSKIDQLRKFLPNLTLKKPSNATKVEKSN